VLPLWRKVAHHLLKGAAHAGVVAAPTNTEGCDSMLKKLAVLAVSCGALVGCGVSPEMEQGEIVDNLVKSGYPVKDIQIVDGDVYVGNDALVTLEASREMLPSTSEEQYRTTNLVGTGVTKICINPDSRYARNATLMAGLDGAIANYNNQGLRITFQRGGTGCTATQTIRISGSAAGGSSGFPSGGVPYGTINIGSSTANYGVNVVKHVVTHEIGHTIGFRHTDYYNRAISCGGAASNEGASTVGAILIPGTPSTATVGGSVMNACFRASETGNWLGADTTALHALY
jgi:hypothetical protein